ncbi:MAG: Lrp/AsnC family transcriptional regulator [Pseudomonadota bacterium]|nr:Lrp/AsnC family transcriptional regulator [Pseudomonadota bacterium]MDP1573017.1 Lrp/AsnC family transcriptional regulator [Pseudomonadota bacterium]MDP1903175.1 Lrp/AsnC family transcriptional regulator [Pseudomonadota bacterium]
MSRRNAECSRAELDETDRRIVNNLQGGFPICEWPFLEAARTLGLDERELIERIDKLLQAGVLTRFGPLFNADRLGGANILAAMSLPDNDFDRVAAFVNAQPEIAHNYRRGHTLNLWFVGAAETPDKVESAFQYIESVTNYPIYRFPKEREFFVELKLQA